MHNPPRGMIRETGSRAPAPRVLDLSALGPGPPRGRLLGNGGAALGFAQRSVALAPGQKLQLASPARGGFVRQPH